MKRLATTIFSLILLVCSAGAENKNGDKPKELPFYFPQGVVQTTDPIKQLKEYYRYLNATDNCFQGNGQNMPLIAGSDSISEKTDIVSTSSTTENPSHLTVVFDHYVRIDSDHIRVTMLCGQTIISEHQFKVVRDDLVEQINIASDRNFAYYKDLTDRAVTELAKVLKVSKEDLHKKLDVKVPGRNVTFRELFYLPKPMRRSDFVPRELHLGYNPPLPGILGVTWLNTGLIYYNPQARIVDYLTGLPKVLQHEEVHGNINLQRLPITDGFDAENMASIPEMLYEENHIDLFSHHYAGDMREIAHIFFGYDFARVKKEVFKVDLAGNLVMDEKIARERLAEMSRVQAEMLDAFREKVLPEFYGKMIWWSAFNEKMKDQNSVFRVVMANNYEITVLGGKAETAKWLQAHEQEIREMAKKAYETKAPMPVDDDMMGMYVPQVFLDIYRNFFTAEEREKIESYYRAHPEELKQLKKMSPKELFNFAKTLKNSKGGAQ